MELLSHDDLRWRTRSVIIDQLLPVATGTTTYGTTAGDKGVRPESDVAFSHFSSTSDFRKAEKHSLTFEGHVLFSVGPGRKLFSLDKVLLCNSNCSSKALLKNKIKKRERERTIQRSTDLIYFFSFRPSRVFVVTSWGVVPQCSKLEVEKTRATIQE